MSEKLYDLLLKLYPDHFRRAYGDEALRLIRDRARDEKGFLSGLRLWFDLLVDLAISLPREYGKAPTTPIAAVQPVDGDPSFQLLAERSLNPALLFLAGMLSAVLFWACVTSVARSRTFPALFQDSLSLQALVQSDLVLARSRPPSEEEAGIHNSARQAYAVPVVTLSFCMTAHRDIPNSVQPLLTFNFVPPGASGVALIDGKIVKIFKNEQRLPIRADVLAGDHEFVLHLDRPAENTSMSSNDDFKYCAPK
jgi:hypothetical protein